MGGICTLLQTDNHASTSSLNVYRPDVLPAAQRTVPKHWRQEVRVRNKCWYVCVGPFRFVDIYGADRLVSKMRAYEQVYGEVFSPCQMLLDHAQDTSRKFHTKWTSTQMTNGASFKLFADNLNCYRCRHLLFGVLIVVTRAVIRLKDLFSRLILD